MSDEQPSRWLRWSSWLLAVYLVLFVAGALAPGVPVVGEAGERFPIFTDSWLADVARNVVLFVPFGLVLGLRAQPLARVALLAFLLSAGIELAQLVIPGRFPSPLDLVSNTTGAALGVGLPRAILALRALERRRPGCLAVGLAAASIGVLGASSVLLQPSFPDSTWFGGWTPELPNLEVYSGRVLEARVGDTEIVEWGPAPDTPALRRAMLDAEPVFVRAEAGARPVRLSPLVTIADEVPRTIMLLAIEGDDLVYLHRTFANAIALHSPRREIVGGLAQVAPGAPFEVRVERTRRSTAITIDDGAARLVDPGPGRTWALWLPMRLVPSPLRAGLDALWTLLLVAPCALLAGRSRVAWGAVGTLCVVAGTIHLVGPLGRPGGVECVAAGLALAAGVVASATGNTDAA